MEAITFNEFRKVAAIQGWSLAWLAAQCRDALDRPTDTIRRVLEGSIVDGKKDDLVQNQGTLLAMVFPNFPL